VNEDELERKNSPFTNTTAWGSDYQIEVPVLFDASPSGGIAPASLTDPTGGQAMQITGNVFQFGIGLTSDLVTYNTVTNPGGVTDYTDACYPIGGLHWYNSTVGGTDAMGQPVLPIGTNPTSIMEGQYFNLKNSLIKLKVSASINKSDTMEYYVNPIHFRLVHVTAKRQNAPLGKIKSVVRSLFLDEYGESRGLENCFDQTANQAVTKQTVLEYSIDKRYYQVHQDTRFSLANQFYDISANTDGIGLAPSLLNNGNSLPSCPSQKEFVIRRNWGGKKTLFRNSNDANAAANGLFEPADDNCKDMIILLAVRGNQQYSSRQLPSVNIGDQGSFGTNFRIPGYSTSFWGLSTGTDP